MKAIYIKEFGGLDKIECGDLPEPPPEPKPGQVRVAVKAAALNHLDIWVRKGRPGVTLKEPHVLGSDAAGTVEALGEGVETVKVGDEVVINAGVSCGQCEFCLRGSQSECPSFRLIGFQNQGAYAEKIDVPAVNVGPKPEHLSMEEAAALTLSHITAWRMLFTRARFQTGESVLIHGIGGGVALAALQIVTASGGEAIVTSSSDEKLARAKKMGATHGINYRTTEEVGSAVLKRTRGRGVDLAVDSVGAPTLPISLEALRRGGRIVTCGITGGSEANVNLQMLYWNHQSILGSTMGAAEDLRKLLRFIGSTGITPVIDQTFPMDQYAEAVKRMESGEQFGKLVLRIS